MAVSVTKQKTITIREVKRVFDVLDAKFRNKGSEDPRWPKIKEDLEAAIGEHHGITADEIDILGPETDIGSKAEKIFEEMSNMVS